jgi:hypothetical protein
VNCFAAEAFDEKKPDYEVLLNFIHLPSLDVILTDR